MAKVLRFYHLVFFSLTLISCSVVTKRSAPAVAKTDTPQINEILPPQKVEEIPSASDVLKERSSEGIPQDPPAQTEAPVNPVENREPSQNPSTPEAAAKLPANEPKTPTTWSYEGNNGPNFWGDLDPSFSLCKTGKQQSPINLKWQKQSTGGEIAFDYKESPLRTVDSGHNLEIKFNSGSFIKIRGQEFELVELQFRSGSEHTFSGEHLPMEAQLIHKNSRGELAILSVMIIEGKENPTIEKLWTHWPQQTNKETLIETVKWNAKDLLPSRFTYYHYTGSLTTPPCTEGVNWNIFNTPAQMSRAQILNFRKKYRLNARPIQPIQNRKLTLY